MYKLGQAMLIFAVLAMLAISILLIIGVIDGKVGGGIFILL